MNIYLRKRIEELQKCREKLTTIRADIVKERTDFEEELELEFPQYTVPERRNTAIRHNLANQNSRREDKIRKFEEKIKPMSEEATKVLDRTCSLEKTSVGNVKKRSRKLLDETNK